MSVHMRKHHTDVTANFAWHGDYYSVPVKVIEQYKVSKRDRDTVSVEEVFNDLLSKFDESGLLLKGLRKKENLTQLAFAKRIGVTQANLSAMESGRRAIGKEIAKRIAKKFHVDYRLFL